MGSVTTFSLISTASHPLTVIDQFSTTFSWFSTASCPLIGIDEVSTTFSLFSIASCPLNVTDHFFNWHIQISSIDCSMCAVSICGAEGMLELHLLWENAKAEDGLFQNKRPNTLNEHLRLDLQCNLPVNTGFGNETCPFLPSEECLQCQQCWSHVTCHLIHCHCFHLLCLFLSGSNICAQAEAFFQIIEPLTGSLI